MNAISRPDGEIGRIATRIGLRYMMGNDTSLAGDEVKTRYSLDILKQHCPQFMTIHLSSLDEEEHLHGPFSPEANADLEGIDEMVQRIVAQEFANYPNAAIVIVSDHGFAPVEHGANLAVPFINAGLIQFQKDSFGRTTIASWQAEPWPAGCVTPRPKSKWSLTTAQVSQSTICPPIEFAAELYIGGVGEPQILRRYSA